MSNLSDLYNEIFTSNSTAVKYAGNILGTLADVGGAVGLGLQIISALTSKDDELAGVLSAIQTDFGQLQAELKGEFAASDKLQRMRDVDQGINPAVGVFEQLPAMLAAAPPPTSDFRLAQIQTCVDAVLFFSDFDDKWQSVQADLPYYSDSWDGELAPPAGADGLVFNYTYTLPQFLRSVYILLTTIGALQPETLPKYKDVLTKCLNRLESVHQTIVTSGIVGTKLPPTSGWLGWQTRDANTGALIEYPYGAVEIYSGASLVTSYKDEFFNFDDVDVKGLGPTVDNFMKLLELRITRQMKTLSTQLALPVGWQVINQLRKLTGQSVSATPLYEDWTFAEVVSILGLTLPPPDQSPVVSNEPKGFEAAVKKFLLDTPPYVAFPLRSPDFPGGRAMHAAIPLPSGSLYTFLTGVSLPVAHA
jgi:hypothetical protein